MNYDDDDADDDGNPGQSRYPVMPSLVALQQMRNRLHLAYLGKKLMKWTALATGKELRRLAAEMNVEFVNYGRDVSMAFMVLARARYFYPNLNNLVLEHISRKAAVVVSIENKSISGVKVMEIHVVDYGVDAYEHLGIEKGGNAISETKRAWRDLIRLMIMMLEKKKTFECLDIANKNATKKQNVLQKFIIPRIINAIAYINSELEEQEREETFRLKRFKQSKKKKSDKLAKILETEEKSQTTEIQPNKEIIQEPNIIKPPIVEPTKEAEEICSCCDSLPDSDADIGKFVCPICKLATETAEMHQEIKIKIAPCQTCLPEITEDKQRLEHLMSHVNQVIRLVKLNQIDVTPENKEEVFNHIPVREKVKHASYSLSCTCSPAVYQGGKTNFMAHEPLELSNSLYTCRESCASESLVESKEILSNLFPEASEECWIRESPQLSSGSVISKSVKHKTEVSQKFGDTEPTKMNCRCPLSHSAAAAAHLRSLPKPRESLAGSSWPCQSCSCAFAERIAWASESYIKSESLKSSCYCPEGANKFSNDSAAYYSAVPQRFKSSTPYLREGIFGPRGTETTNIAGPSQTCSKPYTREGTPGPWGVETTNKSSPSHTGMKPYTREGTPGPWGVETTKKINPSHTCMKPYTREGTPGPWGVDTTNKTGTSRKCMNAYTREGTPGPWGVDMINKTSPCHICMKPYTREGMPGPWGVEMTINTNTSQTHLKPYTREGRPGPWGVEMTAPGGPTQPPMRPYTREGTPGPSGTCETIGTTDPSSTSSNASTTFVTLVCQLYAPFTPESKPVPCDVSQTSSMAGQSNTITQFSKDCATYATSIPEQRGLFIPNTREGKPGPYDDSTVSSITTISETSTNCVSAFSEQNVISSKSSTLVGTSDASINIVDKTHDHCSKDSTTYITVAPPTDTLSIAYTREAKPGPCGIFDIINRDCPSDTINPISKDSATYIADILEQFTSSKPYTRKIQPDSCRISEIIYTTDQAFNHFPKVTTTYITLIPQTNIPFKTNTQRQSGSCTACAVTDTSDLMQTYIEDYTREGKPGPWGVEATAPIRQIESSVRPYTREGIPGPWGVETSNKTGTSQTCMKSYTREGTPGPWRVETTNKSGTSQTCMKLYTREGAPGPWGVEATNKSGTSQTCMKSYTREGTPGPWGVETTNKSGTSQTCMKSYTREGTPGPWGVETTNKSGTSQTCMKSYTREGTPGPWGVETPNKTGTSQTCMKSYTREGTPGPWGVETTNKTGTSQTCMKPYTREGTPGPWGIETTNKTGTSQTCMKSYTREGTPGPWGVETTNKTGTSQTCMKSYTREGTPGPWGVETTNKSGTSQTCMKSYTREGTPGPWGVETPNKTGTSQTCMKSYTREGTPGPWGVETSNKTGTSQTCMKSYTREGTPGPWGVQATNKSGTSQSCMKSYTREGTPGPWGVETTNKSGTSQRCMKSYTREGTPGPWGVETTNKTGTSQTCMKPYTREGTPGPWGIETTNKTGTSQTCMKPYTREGSPGPHSIKTTAPVCSTHPSSTNPCTQEATRRPCGVSVTTNIACPTHAVMNPYTREGMPGPRVVEMTAPYPQRHIPPCKLNTREEQADFNRISDSNATSVLLSTTTFEYCVTSLSKHSSSCARNAPGTTHSLNSTHHLLHICPLVSKTSTAHSTNASCKRSKSARLSSLTTTCSPVTVQYVICQSDIQDAIKKASVPYLSSSCCQVDKQAKNEKASAACIKCRTSEHSGAADNNDMGYAITKASAAYFKNGPSNCTSSSGRYIRQQPSLTMSTTTTSSYVPKWVTSSHFTAVPSGQSSAMSFASLTSLGVKKDICAPYFQGVRCNSVPTVPNMPVLCQMPCATQVDSKKSTHHHDKHTHKHVSSVKSKDHGLHRTSSTHKSSKHSTSSKKRIGYFETKFKEITKISRYRNPDGTITDEKQIITIKTERKCPRNPTDSEEFDLGTCTNTGKEHDFDAVRNIHKKIFGQKCFRDTKSDIIRGSSEKDVCCEMKRCMSAQERSMPKDMVGARPFNPASNVPSTDTFMKPYTREGTPGPWGVEMTNKTGTSQSGMRPYTREGMPGPWGVESTNKSLSTKTLCCNTCKDAKVDGGLDCDCAEVSASTSMTKYGTYMFANPKENKNKYKMGGSGTRYTYNVSTPKTFMKGGMQHSKLIPLNGQISNRGCTTEKSNDDRTCTCPSARPVNAKKLKNTDSCVKCDSNRSCTTGKSNDDRTCTCPSARPVNAKKLKDTDSCVKCEGPHKSLTEAIDSTCGQRRNDLSPCLTCSCPEASPCMTARLECGNKLKDTDSGEKCSCPDQSPPRTTGPVCTNRLKDTDSGEKCSCPDHSPPETTGTTCSCPEGSPCMTARPECSNRLKDTDSGERCSCPDHSSPKTSGPVSANKLKGTDSRVNCNCPDESTPKAIDPICGQRQNDLNTGPTCSCPEGSPCMTARPECTNRLKDTDSGERCSCPDHSPPKMTGPVSANKLKGTNSRVNCECPDESPPKATDPICGQRQNDPNIGPTCSCSEGSPCMTKRPECTNRLKDTDSGERCSCPDHSPPKTTGPVSANKLKGTDSRVNCECPDESPPKAMDPICGQRQNDPNIGPTCSCPEGSPCMTVRPERAHKSKDTLSGDKSPSKSSGLVWINTHKHSHAGEKCACPDESLPKSTGPIYGQRHKDTPGQSPSTTNGLVWINRHKNKDTGERCAYPDASHPKTTGPICGPRQNDTKKALTCSCPEGSPCMTVHPVCANRLEDTGSGEKCTCPDQSPPKTTGPICGHRENNEKNSPDCSCLEESSRMTINTVDGGRPKDIDSGKKYPVSSNPVVTCSKSKFNSAVSAICCSQKESVQHYDNKQNDNGALCDCGSDHLILKAIFMIHSEFSTKSRKTIDQPLNESSKGFRELARAKDSLMQIRSKDAKACVPNLIHHKPEQSISHSEYSHKLVALKPFDQPCYTTKPSPKVDEPLPCVPTCLGHCGSIIESENKIKIKPIPKRKISHNNTSTSDLSSSDIKTITSQLMTPFLRAMWKLSSKSKDIKDSNSRYTIKLIRKAAKTRCCEKSEEDKIVIRNSMLDTLRRFLQHAKGHRREKVVHKNICKSCYSPLSATDSESILKPCPICKSCQDTLPAESEEDYRCTNYVTDSGSPSNKSVGVGQSSSSHNAKCCLSKKHPSACDDAQICCILAKTKIGRNGSCSNNTRSELIATRKFAERKSCGKETASSTRLANTYDVKSRKKGKIEYACAKERSVEGPSYSESHIHSKCESLHSIVRSQSFYEDFFHFNRW